MLTDQFSNRQHRPESDGRARFFKLLRKLTDQGTTVLMVEQNAKSALTMSDDAIAWESGRLVLHRPASELLVDSDIKRLCLGGACDAAAAVTESKMEMLA